MLEYACRLGGMVQPGLVFINMKKYPINTKVVVTVLMIVWYILEIISKVVQLLR